MKDRVHHLRPLRSVDQPSDQSLECALMAAVKHSENGQWPAFVTAIADAIWIQHEGRHEVVSDNRLLTLVRSFAGYEWTPPSSDGEAA